MPNYSTTLLPPILEYTYPGFDYTREFSLNIRLSVGNSIRDVNHAQVRFIGLDDNLNGLNLETNPTKLYFVPLKGTDWDMSSLYKQGDIVYYNDSVYMCITTYEKLPESNSPTNSYYWRRIGGDDNVDLIINPLINDINIFSSQSGTKYPKYYKIQVRLCSADYTAEYVGQNVPQSWLDENTKYISEWSNSATIKTVERPVLYIKGLQNQAEPIYINDPQKTFYGVYETSDEEESLQAYQFTLFSIDNNSIIEQQDLTYISEYEIPTLQYAFRHQSLNNEEFLLQLKIITNSYYEQVVNYYVKIEIPVVKLYNSFSVKENDEKAYNRLKFSANQITLIGTNLSGRWLHDLATTQAAANFNEENITHYLIEEGSIKTPSDWKLPYDEFCFQISFTDFKDRVYTRAVDAFKTYIDKKGKVVNNWLFSIKDEIGETLAYYVGAVYREIKDSSVSSGISKKTEFILKEVIKGSAENLINYYSIGTLDGDYREIDDQEIYILIDKTAGGLRLEINNWLTNIFIEKESEE